MQLVADTVAAIGASGTGKGLYVRERITPLAIAGRRQIFVWSPLEQTDRYGDVLHGVLVQSIPDLCKLAAAGVKRPLVFVPSSDAKLMRGQFDLFCRVVWHSPRAVCVVEELSRVTSASWAPEPWAQLTTAGRHQGLSILATAQRPAMCDKDFLGNCTEIRCFRCNYDADARAMAGVMREPMHAFRDLPDRHYIHRYMRAHRANVRGIQALPFELIIGQKPAHIKKSGARSR